MTERRVEDEQREVQEPVVVRDRRKIDPETGELRRPEGEAMRDGADEVVDVVPDEADAVAAESPEPEEAPAAGGAESTADVAALEKQLEERTADLQRVQAEYANYRRRVDRERESMTENGKASVVSDLLPLLDDLERADAHGDLTGAFKAVADKLVGALERSGLEPFAQEGDVFDPSVHEAVQHDTSPEVDGPTVTMVLRRGYRFGDRVLRAALVGVTDHEPATSGDGAGPVDPPVGGELPVDTDENAR